MWFECFEKSFSSFKFLILLNSLTPLNDNDSWSKSLMFDHPLFFFCDSYLWVFAFWKKYLPFHFSCMITHKKFSNHQSSKMLTSEINCWLIDPVPYSPETYMKLISKNDFNLGGYSFDMYLEALCKWHPTTNVEFTLYVYVINTYCCHSSTNKNLFIIWMPLLWQRKMDLSQTLTHVT